MPSRGFVEKEQAEFFGEVKNKVATTNSSYTPDVTTQETHLVTMSGNVTVNAPSNTSFVNPGNKTCLVFVQDATGGRALSWNAAWRNAPSGLGATAAAGSRALFEFRWDGSNMQYVGGATAFA